MPTNKFENGVLGTFHISSDLFSSQSYFITGTDGTFNLGDPNSLRRRVGLADMCYAIVNNRRPRCHYDIGLHAIEVIHRIQESCETGKVYEMTTRCKRPAPLPASA